MIKFLLFNKVQNSLLHPQPLHLSLIKYLYIKNNYIVYTILNLYFYHFFVKYKIVIILINKKKTQFYNVIKFKLKNIIICKKNIKFNFIIIFKYKMKYL